MSAGRLGGGSLPWLQGLLCGAALAFAAPMALLAAALLAPAAVVAVADPSAGRRLVRPVLFAGLGFTVAPLLRLWTAGQSFAAALDLLADPLVLLPPWLAGACGWALCQLLPLVLLRFWSWRGAARRVALERERAALEAEWDFGE